MPGLKVHEAADKVKPICRGQTNTDILQRRCVLDQLREVLPPVQSMRNSEVDGPAGTPKCYDVAQTEQEDGEGVCPFGTLGTVTERAYKDDEDESDVEFENYVEDSFASAGGHKVEGVGFRVLSGGGDELKRRLSFGPMHSDQVYVRRRKPSRS